LLIQLLLDQQRQQALQALEQQVDGLSRQIKEKLLMGVSLG
jgi:F0F1-type ATP synthase membrane subunit b/b'